MKRLLKFTTVLSLVLTMGLCVSGCSKKSSDKTYDTVVDLCNDGYTSSQTTWDQENNKFKAEYINDDHDSFYFVECDMDQDENDGLTEVIMSSEDEKDTAEYLDKLSNVTITCANDQIPSEKEFSKYVGKTLGELDADGYCTYNTGVDDDGYYKFYRYNDEYVLLIHSDEKAEDPSVLPEDDTSIVIKDISFYEFSLQY